MRSELLLQDFAKKRDLGSLQFDPSGKCQVVINRSTVVTFEKSFDNKGLFIYAIITQVTAEKEEELGMLALKGNLFNRETGGASIGFYEGNRSLILFRYFPEEELDGAFFDREFDSFILYLAYWKNKMEQVTPVELKDLSLDKHIFDLQETKGLKIFFA